MLFISIRNAYVVVIESIEYSTFLEYHLGKGNESLLGTLLRSRFIHRESRVQ
ncbi:hypothetical protein Scep_020805 [Stephania cephalantha]|uniref:Uncharacterized protein n=1 Tax=Stephania cephalantha TaxID=152367 RepID=A0AAP0IDA0_9MAGN